MWFIAFSTIALTSLLSGVLGMGGGMILMGVLAIIMPLSQAMIVHGLTQTVANLSRAWIHRREIHWSIFRWYLMGSQITLIGFFFFALTISKPWFFIALGSVALISQIIPKQLRIEVSKPRNALLCGLLVTASQLLVGVAGSILDLFFIRSRLSRYQVLATKAITQAVGHISKLIFWSGIAIGHLQTDFIAWWVLPVIIVLACAGSHYGAKILARMNDGQFRRITSTVLAIIGISYLVKGSMMLL
ncbi:sulfite exporter TauE/SafE family protein [Gynuella sunshinyii]|uniref:Probable membrane transporter protein n=1 Tax=Gynuella sunshinyii YC6258 TaxID=1445510 RepID=A0A0C5VQF4_9GAMM|nr:sulfite exporter TauE/SafE family protein [Gynuella sunshinyii]AJQ92509.1 putative permease [Gynuella sunshinyii YC6258]